MRSVISSRERSDEDVPSVTNPVPSVFGTKRICSLFSRRSAAKAAIVDADERNLLDSADTFKRKKLTYANLVTAMLASIFNGTRTIANATFTGGSFRLRNAATAFYQSFDVSGLTANRTVKMANRDTDFSSLGWELIQEQNASAGSASLDFVDKLSSVFDEDELVISRVRLSNAASLNARVRYQAPLG